MTISHLIALLSEIQKEHGDLEVKRSHESLSFAPFIGYMHKNGPDRSWIEFCHPKSERGEKVVRL